MNQNKDNSQDMGLWDRCPECGKIIKSKDFKPGKNGDFVVCPECGTDYSEKTHYLVKFGDSEEHLFLSRKVARDFYRIQNTAAAWVVINGVFPELLEAKTNNQGHTGSGF